MSNQFHDPESCCCVECVWNRESERVHGVTVSTGVCQTLSDGSNPSGRSMNTGDLGEIGRYIAAIRLIELGFIVSRPLTENTSYDLVADDGGRLYRVQVKCVHRKMGRLLVRFSSVVQRKHRFYSSKTIDWVLAVDAETKDVFKFDFTTGRYDGQTRCNATEEHRF